MFDFLKKPKQDVAIELPAFNLQFNHRLKIATLYASDPNTPDDAYDELRAHLEKKHYYLQVIIAAVGLAMPPSTGFME